MIELPLSECMKAIAQRIIWFEPAEVAVENPVRFLAYAMRYATFQDMQIIRQQVSDDQLRQVLKHAPPGVIDPRSWAYWHVKLGIFPAPKMPTRRFLDVDPTEMIGN